MTFDAYWSHFLRLYLVKSVGDVVGPPAALLPSSRGLSSPAALPAAVLPVGHHNTR